MKITLEFDTESENFEYAELERHKQALEMLMCLDAIREQLIEWEKRDVRGSIPIDEISDRIFEIMHKYVNFEKMGY